MGGEEKEVGKERRKKRVFPKVEKKQTHKSHAFVLAVESVKRGGTSRGEHPVKKEKENPFAMLRISLVH